MSVEQPACARPWRGFRTAGLWVGVLIGLFVIFGAVFVTFLFTADGTDIDGPVSLGNRLVVGAVGLGIAFSGSLLLLWCALKLARHARCGPHACPRDGNGLGLIPGGRKA